MAFPRFYRGTRADRIISTVDVETRHGRKSQHQRLDGYKLLGGRHEHRRAAEHVGQGRPGIRAGRPAGRRADRTPSPRLGGRGVCWAPPMRSGRPASTRRPATSRCSRRSRRRRSRKAARPSAIHLDVDAGTVTCPAGQESPDSHRALQAAPRWLRQAPLRSLPAARALRRAGPRPPVDPHRTARGDGSVGQQHGWARAIRVVDDQVGALPW